MAVVRISIGRSDCRLGESQAEILESSGLRELVAGTFEPAPAKCALV